RVDVWPPPVPDLRLLYRKWQRIAPPTIVTSDPDTYDPQALTEELARRSNAPSSASTATSRPVSTTTSAANSVGNHASGSSTVHDGQQIGTENGACAEDPAMQQLVSGTISQYDSVVHARPIADVCQITLLSNSVTVFPPMQTTPSPPMSPSSEKQPHSDDTPDEVFGCSGSGWNAMVHLKFATTTDSGSQTEDGSASNSWSVWFATKASAQECAEALVALAKSAGVADVMFCEA
ncbi:hypothetical protein EV175_005975, partial [Coemansia sp. RSA 1933]